MTLILLFISIIPVVLLGLYIYKKDSVKEPKSLLIGLFFSGFLASVLVIVINIFMTAIIPDLYLSDNYNKFNLLELFFLIFIEIALVEEFSKWLMIRFIGYNHKDFDQLYDIIVYSAFVALGFALIENIFYVIEGGFTLGIYRAIFSVPGHAAFGVFMGYYLGLAKMWEKKNKIKHNLFMILSIIVPALLHTIYNFCLMIETFWFLIIFIGFIIVLYVSAVKEVDKVSKVKEF
ncbi:MAG: PrsW family intramembrane metalloprotease [Bacilli bacterium]